MLFTSAAAVGANMSSLVTAANPDQRPLPMATWAFGVIALASFMVLLGVLWTFRNTAAKYDRPGGSGGAGSQGSHRPQGTSGPTDHGSHH
jgi:hypothetical protein